MKIILSRKGVDSSAGGTTSMILPDGRLVSFPIPEETDRGGRYEDLYVMDTSFDKILAMLKKNYGWKYCHIDPDLHQEYRRTKIEGWKPAFGQSDSALSTLDNAGIGIGDIFLFFGNYRATEITSESIFKHCRRTGDFYKDKDIQVIWGYLQIGDIISNQERIYNEYEWHPHSVLCGAKKNALFVPTEHLSFDEGKVDTGLPGCGILDFSEHRVLTKKNCSKAYWKKEIENFTDRRNHSLNPDAVYFRGQWQELVLKETDDVIEWARSMILGE